MVPIETLAILIGLVSALSWGAGDFIGGFATRRTSAYSVVLVTQIIGIIIFPILAFVFSESIPPLNNLLWGAFAGFFGAAGLIALYMGLAKGKMSIVSPLAAVISVIIPVIYSALNEGIPSIFKIMGFIFAFIGIWFIVNVDLGSNLKLTYLEYPLLAGILFGLFFISIDNFSAAAIYWPLTVSRITAFFMLTGFMMFTKTVSKTTLNVILAVILAGLFNTGGAILFALASEAGRLDVATILSSLSPAVTVLLACIVLNEQLAPRQWIGVIASLIAIILISI
ncbi:putative glucose uptake permease [Methanomethylovorans hollandica DSM 15978]|uniref:Putative glucose uptake permease n=1 Tax=Methanomethylovorans hollandica (strain DSM 15978 / NBRC 107637 / DMS1) TaxID=867904 RepID=L0KW85_METHD|nr:DMT family transporter [Methanomethylovorans hollandica]AGB49391.1 putative glucose uptake permease [Methanomethylovorans hollandica DSM 15978]